MSFNDQLNQINVKLATFGAFVGSKLKNFKNLSLGEQISYLAIILGFFVFLAGIALLII